MRSHTHTQANVNHFSTLPVNLNWNTKGVEWVVEQCAICAAIPLVVILSTPHYCSLHLYSRMTRRVQRCGRSVARSASLLVLKPCGLRPLCHHHHRHQWARAPVGLVSAGTSARVCGWAVGVAVWRCGFHFSLETRVTYRSCPSASCYLSHVRSTPKVRWDNWTSHVFH